MSADLIVAPLPHGDDLLDFLEVLRQQGHKLDTSHFAAATHLLAQAYAAPAGAVERERFWSRLVPVLATSADTAHSLAESFQAEFGVTEARGAPDGRDAAAMASAPSPAYAPARAGGPRRRLGVAAAAVLAVVTVVAVLLMASRLAMAPPRAPPIAPRATAAPPRTHVIEVARKATEYVHQQVEATGPNTALIAWITGGLLLAAVALVGLLVWREIRRRKRLVAPLAALHPSGKERRLVVPRAPFAAQFTSGDFRKAAHRLRTPVMIDTHDLDVDRSLRVTLNAAGAFREVKRKRRQLPEYLALIERKSAHDHLAELYRMAVNRLRSEGVDIRPYFFGADPRRLIDESDPGHGPRIVELSSLAALAPGQRVVVLGSTDAFLSPGRTTWPWLDSFLPWRDRALLDPRARSSWDEGELDLLQAGWLLGEARVQGLSALADHLMSGKTGGAVLH